MMRMQSGPQSDPFREELLNMGKRSAKRIPVSRGVEVVDLPQRQIVKPSPNVLSRRDDDDVSTVYSVAGASETVWGGRSVIIKSFPKRKPISDELREERKQRYHSFKYPEKTMEEVALEKTMEINENNLALEKQVQSSDFSRSFMNLKRSAIVPEQTSNLHYGGFSGEVVSSLTNTEKILIWKPKDPMACFGSQWDWGQGGLSVPPLLSPGGKLDNVFIVRFTFTMFYSTFPCSVGVILGQKEDNGSIKPLPGATYYVNSAYSGERASSFHFVIPPFGKSTQEFDFYRSSIHLNNEYGKQFPFLTNDDKNVRLKCEPSGSSYWLVPLRHPIAHWCFEEADLTDDEIPTESADHSVNGEFKFKVPTPVFEEAVLALKRKAELYIPVNDMSKIVLQFIPLMNGPLSADLILRDKIERVAKIKEWEPEYGVQQTTTDIINKEKRKALIEDYGISFTGEYWTMFRGLAEDAVETPQQDARLKEPIVYNDEDEDDT